MKIPEIERDLRDVDPRIRYWFKYQQEQLMAQQQQLDQAAQLLLQFYKVLENLQGVNLHLRDLNIQRVMNKISPKEDGMVKSVINRPEDDN